MGLPRGRALLQAADWKPKDLRALPRLRCADHRDSLVADVSELGCDLKAKRSEGFFYQKGCNGPCDLHSMQHGMEQDIFHMSADCWFYHFKEGAVPPNWLHALASFSKRLVLLNLEVDFVCHRLRT